MERKVSFASIQDKPMKRFTLDPHKLYLNNCTTYYSVFVRAMLSDVKTVGTVLQGNCNAGVSTSKEKEYMDYGASGQRRKALQTFSLILNLRRMGIPLPITPRGIG